MAYQAPETGERLICQTDNVGLYASTSTASEQLKINTAQERGLRGFRKGETVGTVLDDTPIMGTDNNTRFLKVRYMLFRFMKTGLFGQGLFVPEFHEGYVNVADEPLGWIRAIWKPADNVLERKATKEEEIRSFLKVIPGLPPPTEVSKRTVDNQDVWYVGLANGYQEEFDKFKKLTGASQLTFTTRAVQKTPLDSRLTTGNTAGSTPETTLFTPTNILLGIGIVAVLTVLVIQLVNRRNS